MDFIGRMPSLSLSTQNLLKEWIVEVHGESTTQPAPSANKTQIGESPEDDSNGVDHSANDATVDPDVEQELLFEERAGRLMAEKDKLKKENVEMRLSLEDLENRLEHSQTTNVCQSRCSWRNSC